MNYISTRNITGKSEISSAEAIKNGLAPDGGLYMPQQIPALSLDDIRRLAALPYERRASEILSMFLTDYDKKALEEDCAEAYSENRFPGGAAPVVKISENEFALELWHGPTCAFKDMALQLMPRLLSGALRKTGEKRRAFILVATSGDTGKAALEGYRDVDGVDIMVYYPQNGVSTVQKLQMATQEGSNVYVSAVEGNFDDAQNGVKAIFSDREIAERLSEDGYFLSSANSINWGRLVPQIVYYISAYCDLVACGDIRFGEEINISVPTGNFGNILAAYISKEMGLPIHMLVCASNVNNVLTDFLETGVYDRNREFHTTMSPSMDILISSNLERLLYMRCGAERTAVFMKSLKETGRYEIDEETLKSVGRSFTGAYCSEDQTSETIRHIYEHYNYLIDPHTAVGVFCADEFMKHTDSNRKMLAVSTASAYKFAPAVYKAITGVSAQGELEALEKLSLLTGTGIPEPLCGIGQRKIRFDPETGVKADKMAEAMFEALSEIRART